MHCECQVCLMLNDHTKCIQQHCVGEFNVGSRIMISPEERSPCEDSQAKAIRSWHASCGKSASLNAPRGSTVTQSSKRSTRHHCKRALATSDRIKEMQGTHSTASVGAAACCCIIIWCTMQCVVSISSGAPSGQSLSAPTPARLATSGTASEIGKNKISFI